jgi:probable F420-dependent oxidoreductase
VSAAVRLGFVLPQVGPMAGPDALIAVAQRAEELGYNSLWVTERLLSPVAPRAPYPASADGSLPEQFRTVLDPVGTLAFVAAHTHHVRLGTSVLDIPYYNPVMLARQLTTLDVLSGGRLDVGLGLGWSPDEFDAAGATMTNRGERADEFIQLLKAIWTTDPVEFEGRFYRVGKSFIGPKPVQKPHPPLYLAAYTPGAMRRTAHFAHGWNPAGIPLGPMTEMFTGIQAMASQFGRDKPALVVRANCYLTPEPCSDDRPIFVGSIEQIAQDVNAVEGIGASEVFFDVQFSPAVNTTADVIERMEQLWASTQ